MAGRVQAPEASPGRYVRRRDEVSDDEGLDDVLGVDVRGPGADPFDIPAKRAPGERLRRWRQAELVLNASRRHRYTLDLARGVQAPEAGAMAGGVQAPEASPGRYVRRGDEASDDEGYDDVLDVNVRGPGADPIDLPAKRAPVERAPVERLRWRLIKADNIDEAAGQILGYLEDTSKGNVIYCDGWHRLGASTVLKLIAKRLQPSSAAGMADLNPRLKFDRIIHVDCSKWKSRRALQKAIAEQLELPHSVMAIFGQRDEEDDGDGVDEASRTEIVEVATVIYQRVQGRRILVILLNGSSDYVDVNDCGIPIYGYLSNKVLWTFCGRFQLIVQLEEKKREKIRGQSDVILGATLAHSSDGKWWDLVHEEAEEVARSTGIPEPDMKHQMVEDCILYMWALRDVDSIDWGAHASNYWVCDGIIQGEGRGGNDRSAWEIADALHRNMRLDWEDWKIVSRAVSYYQWRPNDRWISASPQYLQQHDHVQQASSGLPPEATSFFLAANRAAEPSINTVLPADMFQHPDSRLRVIQLSCCTFSFTSPPFLCCRNLRFLLLDHCKDGHSGSTDIIKGSADGGVIEHSRNGSWRACFQKLWVLDLSYTDWDRLLSEEMINVMVELRELNVKGVKHWSLSHLRDGGTRSRTWLLNLAKLRATAEPMDDITQAPSMVEFPNLSDAIGLKEVILNDCVGLGQVSPGALPPSLESFTFSVDTSANVKSISFRGCAQLKIALLRGFLGSLEVLDMSGTAVKTLDLRAVQAPNLKRLFLLGCEKLRAILWPPHPQDKSQRTKPEVLHIDTTRSVSHGGRENNRGICHFDFEWNISVRDARLLRSLVRAEQFYIPLMSTEEEGSSDELQIFVVKVLEEEEPPQPNGKEEKFRSTEEEGTPEELQIFAVEVLEEEPPQPKIQPPKESGGKLTHIEISSSTSVVPADGGKAQGISRRSSGSNDTTKESAGVVAITRIETLDAASGSDCSEQQVLLTLQQPGNLYADGIAFKDHVRSAAANGGHAPEITWPYPFYTRKCYMHIQDEMKAELQWGSEGTTTTLPDYVCDSAVILHVHDSLSITSIERYPAEGPAWYLLRLCRIERCPRLRDSVFTAPQGSGGECIFYCLRKFCASQLLEARYIWNWSTVVQPHALSFEDLESLYLDRCPRLIHVLPLSTSMTTRGFRKLETIDIVGCGDLRKVFRLDTEGQEQSSTIVFPNLRRIHLHELPMLQHICGRKMSTPMLETVEIMGCWSLRRLPAVPQEGGRLRRPTVNCEKEWWDRLKWDGLQDSHHSSLYEPRHTPYYKKTLPRGSLFR